MALKIKSLDEIDEFDLTKVFADVEVEISYAKECSFKPAIIHSQHTANYMESLYHLYAAQVSLYKVSMAQNQEIIKLLKSIEMKLLNN